MGTQSDASSHLADEQKEQLRQLGFSERTIFLTRLPFITRRTFYERGAITVTADNHSFIVTLRSTEKDRRMCTTWGEAVHKID